MSDYLSRTAPRMVVWTSMNITYPDNLGSESFTFNTDAGLSLASVTNIDGHVSTYTYGDTWNLSG